MERAHVIFLRAFIAVAIAVNVIAVTSLFMPPGNPWGHARDFVLIFTAPAFVAYAWLHKRRNRHDRK